MKKSNDKGITLLALVITIIVMLILSGIAIGGAIQGVDESRDQKLLSELKMVQHAILERYTKYTLTGDSELLVGDAYSATDDLNTELKGEVELKDNSENYYKVEPTDFSDLGITDINDTYIVNYKTGEVYNYSVKNTSNGTLLYVYGTSTTERRWY